MMPSFTHVLLLGVIGALLFGSKRVPHRLGVAVREFKRGLRGEGEIDVTDSVRRMDPDEKTRT